MKIFYSISWKPFWKILDIVSESDFVLRFFEATINNKPMVVLCILSNQCIIGSNLSSSLMFRWDFLQ